MQGATRAAVTNGKCNNDLKELYLLFEPHGASEMCSYGKFCNIFSSMVAENINLSSFLLTGA